MSKTATANIIGQKFGRLTVVRPSETRADHYVCVCDCGNKTTVRKDNLKSGRVSSCGCYRSERLTGANNPRFGGYPNGETVALRNRVAHAKEHNAVLKRDDKQCQVCGAKGYVHVHHILTIDDYPELYRAEANMITLCPSCHATYHNWCKAVGEEPNDISFFIFYQSKHPDNKTVEGEAL